MRSHVKNYPIDINLTPMMDIVFIMLIFFIVTATFIRETGLNLNQPEENIQQPVTADETSVFIRIDSQNRIFVFDGKNEMITVHPVSILNKLYAEDPQRTFVVRPHKDADTDTMVHVYDIILGVDPKIKVAMTEAWE